MNQILLERIAQIIYLELKNFTHLKHDRREPIVKSYCSINQINLNELEISQICGCLREWDLSQREFQ